jgi:cell division transport system permease protein
MAAQTDMTAESLAPGLPGHVLPNVSSIVPADSIAGRALIAVIAIMTFLAAMTIGAVMVVREAAGEWQSAVAQEMTIQVLPMEGQDVDAEVKKAAEIAAAVPGITAVRVYSKQQSAELIAPWLGNALALGDLPVPRLIVLRVSSAARPDLNVLRQALTAVAGARLDDHRGWIDRMRVMARTAVLCGIGVLSLVVAATVLSVSFATRGAMATNRPIIEVLHFVGAKDGFIAGQFQRHFLLLGLRGGAMGGAAAMVLFLAASFLGEKYLGGVGGEPALGLTPYFAIGPAGYAAVLGLIILIAVVTATTSRLTVYRTLGALE